MKPMHVTFASRPLDGDVLDGGSADGNQRFDVTWIASKTRGGAPGGWLYDIERLRSRTVVRGDGVYKIQSRTENDECIHVNFVFESPDPFEPQSTG